MKGRVGSWDRCQGPGMKRRGGVGARGGAEDVVSQPWDRSWGRSWPWVRLRPRKPSPWSSLNLLSFLLSPLGEKSPHHAPDNLFVFK